MFATCHSPHAEREEYNLGVAKTSASKRPAGMIGSTHRKLPVEDHKDSGNDFAEPDRVQLRISKRGLEAA